MHIEKMSIKELNHSYSYDLIFGNKRGLAILTGPNGYGKTTILNILDALSRKELTFFLTLSFRMIEIVFCDGSALNITKRNEQTDENDDEKSPVYVNFLFYSSEKYLLSSFVLHDLDVEGERRFIRRKLSSLARESYYDEEQSNISDIDIIKKIAQKEGSGQFLMYLSDMKCYLIPADRLNNKEKFPMGMLGTIASSIRKQIIQHRNEFLSKSQEINESFVDRLLGDNERVFTREEYNELASNLGVLMNKMKEYSIIEDISIRDYNDEKQVVSTLDIKALGEKLEVVKPFVEKMELFRHLIEEKQFSNKQLRYDKRSGIIIYDSSSGEVIDIDSLSSGEKNEIVMIYNLIFVVEDGSVLLLDEPENSLHVAWLVNLIDDLRAIGEKKDLQVITATHSPDIVGGNSELAIDLYENNENGS